MKHFTLKALILLPIPVVMACINFVVDPGNLFSASIEKEIADILLEGRNAAAISNYDERKVQKYTIAGLSHAPEVCVLGSSRSMQIGRELFPDLNFRNSSVSAATIHDYIAIYQLYRTRDMLPKRIILGLDPWVLNINGNKERWKTLQKEYNALVTSEFEQSASRDVEFKYFQLLSPSYLQHSIRVLKDGDETAEFYVTDDPAPSDGMLRSDGFRYYPDAHRLATQEQVQENATRYINRSRIYGLKHFVMLDPELRKLCANLLDLMQRDGVEVQLFLPPYHPQVFDYMKESPDYRIVLAVEECFRALAREREIPVVGSYNPHTLHLSEDDFYDGMHPKTEAINQILGN
jgi:hypothetical protein